MPNSYKLNAKGRLEAMYADDGGTWDLSDNDRTAIKMALSMMKTDLAIDQICESLPDGFEVVMKMESGCCDVALESGENIEDFCEDTVADELNEAFNAAMALSK